MKRFWLWFPRWIRVTAGIAATITLVLLLLVAVVWWYLTPSIIRTDGVQYGTRNDTPLMLDVLQPTSPNGVAIAFMASGGWKSGHPGDTPAWVMAPILRRGYTVFSIYHVSQPEATVQQIIQDVNRGVRFVRHHADDYGIDPDRIGISGGSAGGHLSLMLATCGGPGDPNSTDAIDHESSAVQAVGIFYPVTDLLNMGESTENLHDGGPPKSFVKAFGPDSTNPDIWSVIGRECSPIYHVTAETPPTLIYHGDADTLTPLDQSERYRKKAMEVGAKVEIVVHPGGEHGWPTMILDARNIADWFDQHLLRAELE